MSGSIQLFCDTGPFRLTSPGINARRSLYLSIGRRARSGADGLGLYAARALTTASALGVWLSSILEVAQFSPVGTAINWLTQVNSNQLEAGVF